MLIDKFLADRLRIGHVDAPDDGTSNKSQSGRLMNALRAGIHSGTSSSVFPRYQLRRNLTNNIADYTVQLGNALNVIDGLMNGSISNPQWGRGLRPLEASPRQYANGAFCEKCHGSCRGAKIMRAS